MAKQWCVYIVRCKDGTLYTGMTNDIERRIAEHNHLRSGQPKPDRKVELVYLEPVENRSDGRKREHQIKKMPLIEKRKLFEEREFMKIGALTFACPDCDGHFSFKVDFIPDDYALIQNCPFCKNRIEVTMDAIIDEPPATVIELDSARRLSF